MTIAPGLALILIVTMPWGVPLGLAIGTALWLGNRGGPA